jgi:cobalt-zinc-cadmium efflux system membrane fusion protein
LELTSKHCFTEKIMSAKNLVSYLMLGYAAIALCGCNRAPDKSTSKTGSKPGAQSQAAPAAAVPNGDSSKHGWWCEEHGMPESICAQCNNALAADYKAKGDWCKQHDRPESQCFPCHPELEAKFAAQYEAKYGKAPPKPGT